MSEDKRNVLEVLRYELNFLEQGGYSRSVRMSASISPFHDTLTCLNFGEPLRPHACRECLLYDFVPQPQRTEDVPCHHIPITPMGETIADLLQRKDTRAVEHALQEWLKLNIERLESGVGAG